jgi:hypothetical protein
MKKTLFLLMMFALLASAFGVQVGNARAEGSITYAESAYVEGKGFVFIFDASGFRNKQLKDASIYVGSDFYDLFCWVAEDKEHIVCNAQSILLPFAGQTGIIYLAGYIFYVEIPHAGGPNQEATPTCAPGEELGADVSFAISAGFGGGFSTSFVTGSSVANVSSNAAGIVSSSGGFYVGYTLESELYCRSFEEVPT